MTTFYLTQPHRGELRVSFKNANLFLVKDVTILPFKPEGHGGRGGERGEANITKQTSKEEVKKLLTFKPSFHRIGQKYWGEICQICTMEITFLYLYVLTSVFKG